MRKSKGLSLRYRRPFGGQPISKKGVRGQRRDQIIRGWQRAESDPLTLPHNSKMATVMMTRPGNECPRSPVLLRILPRPSQQLQMQTRTRPNQTRADHLGHHQRTRSVSSQSWQIPSQSKSRPRRRRQAKERTVQRHRARDESPFARRDQRTRGRERMRSMVEYPREAGHRSVRSSASYNYIYTLISLIFRDNLSLWPSRQ